MTLKEFINITDGIDEFQVWDGEKFYLQNDYSCGIPAETAKKRVINIEFRIETYDEKIAIVEVE